MTLAFALHLEPAEAGSFVVTCPVLPEVISFGATEQQAIRNGGSQVEQAVNQRVAEWIDIELTVDVVKWRAAAQLGWLAKLSQEAAMKLMLFRACRQHRVTKAKLARRLGWRREQVDVLFRLNGANRLTQIEEALAVFGRTVDLYLSEPTAEATA